MPIQSAFFGFYGTSTSPVPRGRRIVRVKLAAVHCEHRTAAGVFFYSNQGVSKKCGVSHFFPLEIIRATP